MFRKVFELQVAAKTCHIRILARNPPTTKSEGFSLLCCPVWGGVPFLSDLGAFPYDNAPMSTPGLGRTRLPHPVNSGIPTPAATLKPYYPDRSISVTSWRHSTRCLPHESLHYLYALRTHFQNHPIDNKSYRDSASDFSRPSRSCSIRDCFLICTRVEAESISLSSLQKLSYALIASALSPLGRLLLKVTYSRTRFISQSILLSNSVDDIFTYRFVHAHISLT